jgi:hypothetical protein
MHLILIMFIKGIGRHDFCIVKILILWTPWLRFKFAWEVFQRFSSSSQTIHHVGNINNTSISLELYVLIGTSISLELYVLIGTSISLELYVLIGYSVNMRHSTFQYKNILVEQLFFFIIPGYSYFFWCKYSCVI